MYQEFFARHGDYKHGGGPSKKVSKRNERQIIKKVSKEGAKSLQKVKSELISFQRHKRAISERRGIQIQGS